MLKIIITNVLRRPLRNGLALGGIAVAIAALVCVESFAKEYRQALRVELDQAGVEIMLVPLGCPYDAAARVLKNNTLENSLPLAALQTVRSDPAVAVAAPLLIAGVARQDQRRTDTWVGLDESALQLKPWWRVRTGGSWFTNSGDVILGADVAAIEIRSVGDKFFSPETQREFRVAGILERSGTSDDSALFVPMATAQEMFAQTGRVTAIAIRLKDPTFASETTARLQEIRGAQAVTMTEMLGTFMTLVGSARSVVVAIVSIVVAVSGITVFNTLLAGVVERTREFALMRAVGASQRQVFALLIGEALLLTLAGLTCGILLAIAAGPYIHHVAKMWIPFAPVRTLSGISAEVFMKGFGAALCAGLLAALYPALLASRMRPAIATKAS